MICFNGCSFTWGEGFTEQERQIYSYPCVVGKHLDEEVYNIAKKGSSNYLTFLRSAEAIQSNKYDIVFTQWTALNRLWLFPSPTTEFFTNDNITEYNYNGIYFSKKKKKQLVSDLKILNGDYQNILDLVQYCNILDDLALLYNTPTFYINGLLPWTDELFEKIPFNNLTNELSNYSKELFNFENLDDNEIIAFYEKLLSNLLLIDQNKWINIFDSFIDNVTDNTPEGHHPGIKSNQWMANKIIKFLSEND